MVKVVEPRDGDGAGVRVFQGVTTRTDPSRTERLHPGMGAEGAQVCSAVDGQLEAREPDL